MRQEQVGRQHEQPDRAVEPGVVSEHGARQGQKGYVAQQYQDQGLPVADGLRCHETSQDVSNGDQRQASHLSPL